MELLKISGCILKADEAASNFYKNRPVKSKDSKIEIFNMKFVNLIAKNIPGCIFKANGPR